jgi:predicted ATP-dependent protease
MATAKRLEPDKLRKRCEPASIPYADTTAAPPLGATIGQQRAERALDFGLSIKTKGFNIFAAGPVGTGKDTTVRQHVGKVAKTEATPDDWCYVYDFADPRRPMALKLTAGRGVQLVKDVDELIRDAREELPKVFESEEYERRRNQLLAGLQKTRDELLRQTQVKAADMGFELRMTLQGFATLPIVDGKPVEPEQFDSLSEDAKREIQKRSTKLQDEIRGVMRRMRAMEKAARDSMQDLDKEMSLLAVGHLIEGLKDKYAQCEQVLAHLDAIEADIVEHLEDFKKEDGQPQLPILMPQASPEATFARYGVNLFVNNAETKGAPVVVEQNPHYYSLFGRIEYEAFLGGASTDFREIKAGSLARANGGYLVFQALDALMSPMVWETLKRTLRSGELRTENLGEQYRLFPVATLEPEPIPIDVKVVMIGSPYIHAVLDAADDDFRKLFKVKADFEVDIPRTARAIRDYCRFIADLVRAHGLCDLDRSGLAKLVEYGSWLADDQKRLSVRFMDVGDLASEAAFWATKNGHCLATAEDVNRALEEKRARVNLLEERVQRAIEEDVLMVDVAGEVAGQVNGLAVYADGDVAFGRPNRITARTRMGREGVIDIEREAKLSGPTHSKGVLILESYLSATFGQTRPLALSGTITFEQSYGGIEGDSASMAELCALISSLADAPILQGTAITGSVNQFGKAQAIGGVNRKIEGFFDVCKAKGLTGEQGVLVPRANVANLMLREDVVGAVDAGRFHVWQYSDVAQAAEALTGVPLGRRRRDGSFTVGSLLARADAKLAGYAKLLHEFGGNGKKDQGKTD